MNANPTWLQIIQAFFAGWAFTLAGPAYSQARALGGMTFQTLCGLAYGARAMQYFSYSLNHYMLDPDGTPNEGWFRAQRLNRKLRALAQVLMPLRSIGVYHHPADFFYTRPLDQYTLGHPNDLFARGDPVVAGQFVDAHLNGYEYVLIVNRNPLAPAAIAFHFGCESVEEYRHADGKWMAPFPNRPRAQPLTFEPGDGRLFRFKRHL